MKRQQRFSLRKFKFGLASALLGTALIFGSGQANADEQTAVSTAEASQQPSLVATADSSEQGSLSADKATVKEEKSQASEEVDKSSSSEPANAQAPSAGETKEEKQVASETTVAIEPKQTVSTAEVTSPSSAKKLKSARTSNLPASVVMKSSRFLKLGLKVIKGKVAWLLLSTLV